MSAARSFGFTATGLTKRFEGVPAVREVNFSVPTGTIAALVGPPGSGKTTIVRLLLGHILPTSGTAALGGTVGRARATGTVGQARTTGTVGQARTTSTVGRSRAAGKPVGAVLQPHGLHPARTVRGEARVHAAAVGASDGRVDELLALLSLESVARQRIRMVPIGVRTRLALAIALLGDPPLLILDDPLAGLDAAEHAWLSEYLRGLARRGTTTLVTSQSLAAALPMADQLIVLSAGSAVYQGSPRRLRRSHPDRLVVGASSPIALATTLAGQGFTDTVMRPDGRLAIAEASPTEIEAAARTAQVQLTELIPEPVHPDRVLATLTRTTHPAAPPTTAPAIPNGTPS